MYRRTMLLVLAVGDKRPRGIENPAPRFARDA